MLALITKGDNTGIVVDLIHDRNCIYTDGNETYLISEFVALDTIEAELETKKRQIASLNKEVGLIERYLNGKNR